MSRTTSRSDVPVHEACGHPLLRHRSNGKCADCDCVMEAQTPQAPRDPSPREKVAVAFGLAQGVLTGGQPNAAGLQLIPPSRDPHTRMLAQSVVLLAQALLESQKASDPEQQAVSDAES